MFLRLPKMSSGQVRAPETGTDLGRVAMTEQVDPKPEIEQYTRSLFHPDLAAHQVTG
ncbi:MAG: hypothetical protein ACRDP6_08300 [Actinoallomurus sp.]